MGSCRERINTGQAKPMGDFATAAATIGVIAAGVALFEVALIPGMAIGAVAVLAPKYVPKLRRRLRPPLNSTVRRRIKPALTPPDRPDVKLPLVAPAGLEIKQALAKTITFQIIVTTLDFTTHYVVVGNLATAASLSAFHLVVRPLYYLVHETTWNYLSPPVRRKAGLGGQSGIGQDRHLSHHRHDPGLHYSLRRGRQPRHGGGAVGLRLRGQSFCLFRPRDGLGLLWLA